MIGLERGVVGFHALQNAIPMQFPANGDPAVENVMQRQKTVKCALISLCNTRHSFSCWRPSIAQYRCLDWKIKSGFSGVGLV
jgi:hypothetical protein